MRRKGKTEPYLDTKLSEQHRRKVKVSTKRDKAEQSDTKCERNQKFVAPRLMRGPLSLFADASRVWEVRGPEKKSGGLRGLT